jgi:hypothetical protein
VSGAAAAKVETAPARGADRERQHSRAYENGGTRGWPPPRAGQVGLRIGRVDEPEDVAADRFAGQALAGGVGAPQLRTTPSAPAPRVDANAGGLPARIAAASDEAQDLPAAQRDFFALRFGHRFDGVRIHAGPAAAAAASAGRAQALTLGRDIYFGDGRYRPDGAAGRQLLAHELAHTLQDRPNVVARRALDTTFDLPESDPDVGVGLGRADSGPAMDELATLVDAGPPRGNAQVRERLDRLKPDTRAAAVASLSARLPAADRGKVATLGEEALGMPPQPEAVPSRMPEVRPGETRPAPVEAAEASPEQRPTPAHERAVDAAAAKMQEAVRSVGAEAPLDGAATQPPGSLEPPALRRAAKARAGCRRAALQRRHSRSPRCSGHRWRSCRACRACPYGSATSQEGRRETRKRSRA